MISLPEGMVAVHRWMTLHEFGDALGYSYWTVLRLCQLKGGKRRIKSVGTGKLRRISAAEQERWLKENEV